MWATWRTWWSHCPSSCPRWRQTPILAMSWRSQGTWHMVHDAKVKGTLRTDHGDIPFSISSWGFAYIENLLLKFIWLHAMGFGRRDGFSGVQQVLSYNSTSASLSETWGWALPTFPVYIPPWYFLTTVLWRIPFLNKLLSHRQELSYQGEDSELPCIN